MKFDDCISRARQKHEGGSLPVDLFAAFLDNPEVVLIGMDELELARLTSRGGSKQSISSIIADIAHVTHDRVDLQRLQQMHLSGSSNPETQREMSFHLVRTLLACGDISEAEGVAESIPQGEARADAWVVIARHTKRAEHIERARIHVAAVDSGDPGGGAKRWGHIALLSHDGADLERVEWSIGRFSRRRPRDTKRANSHEWLLVPYTRCLIEMGRLDRARSLMNRLTLTEARLALEVYWLEMDSGSSAFGAFRAWFHGLEIPFKSKDIEHIVRAHLLGGKPEELRAFIAGRMSPVQRCLGSALLAASELGSADDLRSAILATRDPAINTEGGMDAALLALVRALARNAAYSDGKTTALKIGLQRTRCRAYLALYTSLHGMKDPHQEDDL